jgi:hypothetical protein
MDPVPTQIVKGDCGLAKLCSGQSINFAKLNRKAVFTSYPVAPLDWPRAIKARTEDTEINKTIAEISRLVNRELRDRLSQSTGQHFVSPAINLILSSLKTPYEFCVGTALN